MLKALPNLKGCLTQDAAAMANVIAADNNTFAYVEYQLGAEDWTYAQLGEAPDCEIVRISGTSNGNLLVTRGYDGTVGTAFPTGTEIKYFFGQQAVQDMLNALVVNPVTITGEGIVTVEQIATNVYNVIVPTPNLTSDGSIDVLGTYPNIELAVSSTANGCCG